MDLGPEGPAGQGGPGPSAALPLRESAGRGAAWRRRQAAGPGSPHPPRAAGARPPGACGRAHAHTHARSRRRQRRRKEPRSESEQPLVKEKDMHRQLGNLCRWQRAGQAGHRHAARSQQLVCARRPPAEKTPPRRAWRPSDNKVPLALASAHPASSGPGGHCGGHPMGALDVQGPHPAASPCQTCC